VTATCPEGHFVIAGGVFSSTRDAMIYESRPFGDALNAWRVSAVGPESFTLDVYAICVQIGPEIEVFFPMIEAQEVTVTSTPTGN
jgi:hypothetical protein